MTLFTSLSVSPKRLTDFLYGRWLTFAVSYAVAVNLGLYFVAQPEGLSVIWPASGVALAALLLSSRREWWGLLVMAFFINLFSNLVHGVAFAPSVGFALANTLEPALGGGLMRWLLDDQIRFVRLRDVVGLGLVTIFANAVTAAIGSFIPVQFFYAAYDITWLTWWILDGLSLALITPLIVTMLNAHPALSLNTFPRRMESLLWLTFLGLVTWAIFGIDWANFYLEPRSYMLLPILVLVALRSSPRTVAAALTVVSGVALVATAFGSGVYPLGGTTMRERLIAVQGFLAVTSLSTLMLSAVLAERRLAAEALLQTQVLLRASLESFKDTIVLSIDTNYRYLYFNSVHQAVMRTAYNVDVTLEMNLLDCITIEADRILAKVNYDRALRGESHSTIQEFGVVQRMYYETFYNPIRDEQNNIIGATAFARDVTERKLNENIDQAHLRVTEFASTHALDAVLQNVIDELCALTASPVGFFHLVKPNQHTLVLQAWSTRTLQEMCTAEGKGHTYEISQAGVWMDCVRERRPLIHNDYAALPHRKGLPAGHAPIVRQMLFPIIRDQTIVAVLGVGNKAFDYTEADLAYTAHLADLIWNVTERKRAEESLQKSEALLKATSELARTGGWAINLATQTLEWTDEVYAIHEVAADFKPEVATAINFYAPASQPLITEAVQQVIEQGKPFDLELQLVTAKGNWLWVRAVGRAQYEDDKIVKVLGAFQDITTRKQAAAEREQLLVELEHKNKELESLVYIASHDLRSPLVNIQGFGKNLQKYFRQLSELLQQSLSLTEIRTEVQPLLTERIPTALRFVETASTKMDTLIDGLLRLSRLGRIPLQLAPINLSELLQSIVEAMAFDIEKANARIELSSSLAECYGDANQLNQVFSNLIDNALKYRAMERPLVITISSVVTPERVIYTVADTGIGIAPEHYDKIWEIFRRLHGEAVVAGEGLGLSIARRIVERHGGQIWVESVVDVGSRFQVALPVAPPRVAKS